MREDRNTQTPIPDKQESAQHEDARNQLRPTLQALRAYIGGFSTTAVTGWLDVTTAR